MNIAFYLSDHGFGHPARNIPIIAELLKQDELLKIFVKCGKKQIDFMKHNLKNYAPRIKFYNCGTDLGLILKEGSMEVNKVLLKEKLISNIDSWEVRIAEESKFIQCNEIDLVVSDIVPWIFKSCKLSAVKSVFISNFTWVEIYKDYFDKDIWGAFEDLYKFADYSFIYPLGKEVSTYFKNPEDVGLSCRSFNLVEAEKIKKLHFKPIVYVSLGRSAELEEPIDVHELPYYFIYTEGIKLEGNNTFKLPIETENTQDHIMASQYVITKAGWGTVAECICAKKPMLVIRRDEVSEDRNTLNALVELGIAEPITFQQLNPKDINCLLNRLEEKRENFNNLSAKFTNCYDEIAAKLLTILKE